MDSQLHKHTHKHRLYSVVMAVVMVLVVLFGAQSGAIWSEGFTEMKESQMMWARVKETAFLYCLLHSLGSLRLAKHLSQCSSTVLLTTAFTTEHKSAFFHTIWWTMWQRIGILARTKRYSSGQVTGFCCRLSDRAQWQLGKNWMLTPEVIQEKRGRKLKVIDVHTHTPLFATQFDLLRSQKKETLSMRRDHCKLAVMQTFWKDTQSRASLDTGRHGRFLVVLRRLVEILEGWL